MSYRYTLEDLLLALEPAAPVKVNAVLSSRRRVEQGLLTVGLKLHCFGDTEGFNQLIEALGGSNKILEINHYRRSAATFTLVLPPVGNARTAILLLECIEHATNMPIFGSKDVQIQICSPGRLTPVRAAMLGIAFYLGSDTIRRYTLGDFETTFSDADELHPALKPYERGRRLVLYDAPWGMFDRDFEWWRRRQVSRRLHRRTQLPFAGERTDTISAKSRVDINNVNLISTLLCHVQYDGYWAFLGREFEERLQKILHTHLLDDLLYASWIHTDEATKEGDREFILALGQLMSYAIQDSFRVRREGKVKDRPPGILAEVKQLLQDMRSKLNEDAIQVQKGMNG